MGFVFCVCVILLMLYILNNLIVLIDIYIGVLQVFLMLLLVLYIYK